LLLQSEANTKDLSRVIKLETISYTANACGQQKEMTYRVLGTPTSVSHLFKFELLSN